jgi:hypothetical protein
MANDLKRVGQSAPVTYDVALDELSCGSVGTAAPSRGRFRLFGCFEAKVGRELSHTTIIDTYSIAIEVSAARPLTRLSKTDSNLPIL